MANSSSPFRRTGTNSWEELLDQVNEELQNPPEDTDCEPIDEIPTPDEPHRWAKSDIQEVHDKLNEMPKDCFEFEDIPDLWKISIITDIENQLSNSWCDCEDDEICCEPCSNAGEEMTEFLGNFPHSGKCCTPFSACPGCADDNTRCEEEICRPFRPLGPRFDFEITHGERCALDIEVENLEKELQDLKDAKQTCIDNADTPEEITACDTEFDTQIEEKQIELDEKKSERDDKLAEEDGFKADYRSEGAALGQCWIDCADCNSVFAALGPTSGPGYDDTCIDPCCGNVHDNCTTLWIMRKRVAGNFTPNSFGNFRNAMGGFYDQDGIPIPVSHRSPGCYCLPEFSCACTKLPGQGAPGVACSSCGGGGLNCADYGEPGFGSTEWERVDRPPRSFDPFDCIDGGPCDGIAGEPA